MQNGHKNKFQVRGCMEAFKEAEACGKMPTKNYTHEKETETDNSNGNNGNDSNNDRDKNIKNNNRNGRE